jgi:hypothetical protein
MAGFGKDFGRGLAKGGIGAAQQSAMLALRQALEEPRTEAEMEMAQRRLANDEADTRLRMDLLREQLANTRADTQYEAQTRARESSPEALALQKRKQEAEISKDEALADQRKQQKKLSEERLAAISDPEELKAMDAFTKSDAYRFADNPAEAMAKHQYEYRIARKKYGGSAKTDGPKAAPAIRGDKPKADPNAPVMMKLPGGRIVPIKADRVKDAESKGAVRA